MPSSVSPYKSVGRCASQIPTSFSRKAVAVRSFRNTCFQSSWVRTTVSRLLMQIILIGHILLSPHVWPHDFRFLQANVLNYFDLANATVNVTCACIHVRPRTRFKPLPVFYFSINASPFSGSCSRFAREEGRGFYLISLKKGAF